MTYFRKIISCPVGQLFLIANDQSLCAILWENDKRNILEKFGLLKEDANHPVFLQTEQELTEYFAKKRQIFNVPLAFSGTVFQTQIWKILQKIPFGMTKSYEEIAVLIEKPKAFRSVGAAIAQNPISIIIPCHRVIAKNGKLQGFAGGLEVKKNLLDFEMC